MGPFERVKQDQRNQLYRILLMAGIIIVSFNLRPGMTSVGPLVGVIRDDVGLANWSAGLLTSLPLIAFAAISPFVPWISERLKDDWTMSLGLFIIIIGISVRSTAIISLLFFGTILVGLGIAICNVLLPRVIKDRFPTKVAFMTGVYSTLMGIFAAVASGFSVPLAKIMPFDWQGSLLVWTIPAAFGMFLWTYIAVKNQSNDEEGDFLKGMPKNGGIWRSPLAWQVAFFMGLQSSLFYVSISWLPEILHFNGLNITTSGWMLSYTQLIGMPASFMVPVIAGRLRSQRSLVLCLGLSALIGLCGLLISESFIPLVISCTFLGITLGGWFALALTFLAIRAKNAHDAGQLSGMAQSIGYLLAALGPVFIGYLYDLTKAWDIPLIVLIIITIIVILFGLGAGRDRYVLN